MEKQAAVTFDFYSLLLNGINATTNFSYTGGKVKEMLDSFVNNGNRFDALLFA